MQLNTTLTQHNNKTPQLSHKRKITKNTNSVIIYVCGYVKGGMLIGIHFVKPEVCGFRIYPLLEGVYGTILLLE